MYSVEYTTADIRYTCKYINHTTPTNEGMEVDACVLSVPNSKNQVKRPSKLENLEILEI